jgi:hypothetical protein
MTTHFHSPDCHITKQAWSTSNSSQHGTRKICSHMFNYHFLTAQREINVFAYKFLAILSLKSQAIMFLMTIEAENKHSNLDDVHVPFRIFYLLYTLLGRILLTKTQTKASMKYICTPIHNINVIPESNRFGNEIFLSYHYHCG